MALQDSLRSLGLFVLPTSDVDRVLLDYEIRVKSVRNYLAASLAEVGLFTAGVQGSLRWPLELPPGLLEVVKYKCNTITYSCGYHKSRIEPRSEYIFFFSSDCWKLREILRGEEPLPLVLRDPLRLRGAIAKSGWELIPSPNDPRKVVPDVALLLWHVKARILDQPDTSDEDVSSAIESLFGEMDIKQRLR